MQEKHTCDIMIAEDLTELVHDLANMAVSGQKQLTEDMESAGLRDKLVEANNFYFQRLWDKERQLAKENGAQAAWEFIVPQSGKYDLETYYLVNAYAYEHAMAKTREKYLGEEYVQS